MSCPDIFISVNIRFNTCILYENVLSANPSIILKYAQFRQSIKELFAIKYINTGTSIIRNPIIPYFIHLNISLNSFSFINTIPMIM